jgi:hypothetical protein
MSGISPQQKEGSSKKGEQGLKRQRGETSVSKREQKEDEIYKLLGEILLKERKEITFSYSAKSDVWHDPYPHIICI